MRVKFNQTVKHDGRVYSAGDEMTIEDELGTYFLRCGWVGDAPKPPSDITLDVKSTKHKSAAKEI